MWKQSFHLHRTRTWSLTYST